jgi:nucleotide-binding universal stress UspA family protein
MGATRILLPVKGGKIDDETLRLASRVVRHERGSIVALYVIEVPREFPVDCELPEETRRGEEVLRQVEEGLRQHKCKLASAELLQARDVGPAVVQEAIEREADLILLGISYKRRHGAFSMGQTVPYIMANAPCKVLVLRGAHPVEPPPDAQAPLSASESVQ